MIKVFGVGNIMLCDDGIGVKVAEYIKNELESSKNKKIRVNKNEKLGLKDKWKLGDCNDVEVIIGETDFMYCLEYINEGDFIIIIDGTYFDLKPGHVSKLSFKECDNFIEEVKDAHGDNLLKVLRREYRDITGCLIGIEIEKVDYSLELSPKLNKEFNGICERVLEKILSLVKYNKEQRCVTQANGVK